eukprot:TRINITY_DN19927_c0_g2_i1.p1 TRINITY_DN19927_c0_g2~~TRINITY_DN19927_c0_g2_i1.p1  ORF type:complete len:885 (+),score=176.04 TRINITY_DN19927_c0_g2_i1:200-2854(+)
MIGAVQNAKKAASAWVASVRVPTVMMLFDEEKEELSTSLISQSEIKLKSAEAKEEQEIYDHSIEPESELDPKKETDATDVLGLGVLAARLAGQLVYPAEPESPLDSEAWGGSTWLRPWKQVSAAPHEDNKRELSDEACKSIGCLVAKQAATAPNNDLLHEELEASELPLGRGPPTPPTPQQLHTAQPWDGVPLANVDGGNDVGAKAFGDNEVLNNLEHIFRGFTADKMHSCLRALRLQKAAKPFLALPSKGPALKAFLAMTKNPIDLKTIELRLHGGYYESTGELRPELFWADLGDCWENCRRYHGGDETCEPVRLANEMSLVYEALERHFWEDDAGWSCWKGPDWERLLVGWSRERMRRSLRFLQMHENAAFFNGPFPWKEMGLSDYLEVIAKPMDLGTISDRLESGLIEDARVFWDDVAQCWDNCSTYFEHFRSTSRGIGYCAATQQQVQLQCLAKGLREVAEDLERTLWLDLSDVRHCLGESVVPIVTPRGVAEERSTPLAPAARPPSPAGVCRVSVCASSEDERGSDGPPGLAFHSCSDSEGSCRGGVAALPAPCTIAARGAAKIASTTDDLLHAFQSSTLGRRRLGMSVVEETPTGASNGEDAEYSAPIAAVTVGDCNDANVASSATTLKGTTQFRPPPGLPPPPSTVAEESASTISLVRGSDDGERLGARCSTATVSLAQASAAATNSDVHAARTGGSTGSGRAQKAKSQSTPRGEFIRNDGSSRGGSSGEAARRSKLIAEHDVIIHNWCQRQLTVCLKELLRPFEENAGCRVALDLQAVGERFASGGYEDKHKLIHPDIFWREVRKCFRGRAPPGGTSSSSAADSDSGVAPARRGARELENKFWLALTHFEKSLAEADNIMWTQPQGDTHAASSSSS